MARGGPLTWRNITTDGGFGAASNFMQQAQSGMNQGMQGLDSLAQRWQQNQDANQTNRVENNRHALRQELLGMGGPQAIQQAQESGDLSNLYARYQQQNGGLGPRFDTQALTQELIDSGRQRETTEHDHGRMLAQRAADPLQQELERRVALGDIPGANQFLDQNQQSFMDAGIYGSLASDLRNTQRSDEQYRFSQEQRDQTRAGWNREQGLRDAQAEADTRLSNVNWQADPYTARSEYFEALGNLPFSERIAREQEFTREWDRRNDLTAEDGERLRNELEQQDAIYAANMQHTQTALDSFQSELDRLPTAIRNDVPQDGGQALLYLAEKFKIDRDALTGNDIQKGFNDLVEQSKTALEAEGLDGNISPYSVAIAAAERAISKQHDDGTLEVNLRNPKWFLGLWGSNAGSAQAYVDTVLEELGGGRHAQHITTRDNLTRAIHEHQRNLTDAEPNRLAHRQRYADQFRQTVRDRRILRGEVDRPN